jgi:hypothetical protein
VKVLNTAFIAMISVIEKLADVSMTKIISNAKSHLLVETTGGLAQRFAAINRNIVQ